MAGSDEIPSAPQDVRIHSVTFKSFKVGWKAPAKGSVSKYWICVVYYDLEDPTARRLDEVEVEEDGKDVLSVEINHPNMAYDGTNPKEHLKACTVKVTVTAMTAESAGGNATKTTSWYDIWDPDSRRGSEDIKRRTEDLRKVCKEFEEKKGRNRIDVLVLGHQHAGKSSFFNSLKRCSRARLNIPDALQTASAGGKEVTLEIMYVDLQFGDFVFRFIDTPAFPNVKDYRKEIQALLAWGARDGTRRSGLASAGTLSQRLRDRFQGLPQLDAPDAAIVVVSVQEYVAKRDEVKEYLAHMAKLFQHACGGRVFPYGVAVTKCDALLRDSQSSSPHTDLSDHVETLGESANTEKILPVVNYKYSSVWSQTVNANVFRLLEEVVVLAQGTNTNGLVEKARKWDGTFVMGTFIFGVTLVLLLLLAVSVWGISTLLTSTVAIVFGGGGVFIAIRCAPGAL